MEQRIRDEIETLHRFFVDWFGAACPDRDEVFDAGFAARLAADFHYIMPTGALHDRASIVGSLRAAHGQNPGFAIAITDVTVRARRGDVVLTTYVEWQRGARAVDRADSGRLSSAALLVDDTAPRGLRWLHVHETWLPAERLADNPLLAGAG